MLWAGAQAKVRRSSFQSSDYSLGRSLLSLVPRPQPLPRRNQVEFIGHTFATASPSNVQNILRQTHSGYPSRDKIFYCCKRHVIITDISQFHWSFPLLGNKPRKFDFVCQTISCWNIGSRTFSWHLVGGEGYGRGLEFPPRNLKKLSMVIVVAAILAI